MQYIIKSERHKLKQNIKKSMELIADEFQDYDLYKENYDFLNHLPIVRDLKRQIKRLQDENTALRNYNAVSHKKTKTSRKTLYKNSFEDMDECLAVQNNDTTVDDHVYIKIEPDVILVEKVKPDNIVYELIDEDTDVEVVEETDAPNDVVLEVEADVVLDEEEAKQDEDVVEEPKQDEEVVLEEAKQEEDEEEQEEVVLEEEEEEEQEVEANVVLEEEEQEEEQEEDEEEEEVLEEEQVEEEEQEEEEEEEQEEQEEEEQEEQEEVLEEEQEEEESEVYEITIKNKKYYTTNETNGVIYFSDKNGDVGDEVGQFKNGKATFTK
jgi:hypothetical protein